MNSKCFSLLVFVLAFYSLGFSQVGDNNKISVNEFYTEKKGDSLNFLEKINNKYRKSWVYVDYETGDASSCVGFSGVIEKGNNNYFEIINNDVTKTDVWVIFMRAVGSNNYSIERKCFVKYNESFRVRNLKAGEYKLTIKHGNKWKQPLDFSCQGRFMENYRNIAYKG